MAPTAIVIEVPAAEPLLGPLRRLHTEDGAQGMSAHVTLLFPFADTLLLDARRLQAAAEVVDGFETFDFCFRETRRFPENDRVLYLRPDPDAPFRALTEALVAAFPEHPPYGGKYRDPIPHATVAIGDDALLVQLAREVAEHLPIAARATEATLVELDEATWRPRRRFPLRPNGR